MIESTSTFTKEFLNLIGDSKWEVLTALRGPDADFRSFEINYVVEDIKRCLTGRIRHLTFGSRNLRCGAIWCEKTFSGDDLEFLRENLKQIREKTTQKDRVHLQHYLMHTRMAILATNTHAIWGGDSALVADLTSLLYEAQAQ